MDSPIVEDTLAHEDSTIEDTQRPSQEPPATLFKAQMSVTDSDDQILNSGTRVDHYQVLRFIASGGMGEVYLARDLKLGRQVALKLVHAKLAHRAGWARRFYEEAKITATLNHPHIVTLHSVGEYRGRPYAALEYLEGQALSEALSRIDLSFDDRLSICQSITSGVAEAHRVGFVHRDLKPSNVILADDGRPRVVDFGLATPIDSDSARKELSGTPPYMAPEQWSGDEITTATDVWAIGVIIFRALSAQMPFTEPTLDALQTRVCERPLRLNPFSLLDELDGDERGVLSLIERCLSPIPRDRPSCDQLLSELETLRVDQRRALFSEQSPYRGLLPFSEHHAHLYFGRRRECIQAAERLTAESSLLVVGPSGSGKSSFVRAGLLPRLKAQKPWELIVLRPGTAPIQRLARALCVDRSQTSSAPSRQNFSALQTPPPLPDTESEARRSATEVEARLRAHPEHLGLLLSEWASTSQRPILLLIDQLEELFTLGVSKDDQQVFIDCLRSAVYDPIEPIRLIFTLRSDFLEALTQLGERVRPLLEHLLVLTLPDTDQLKEALVAPLDHLGYTFEDPLMIEEMIEEATNGRSTLPLLQFTASLLWERRDRHTNEIPRAALEALGGVSGALSQHADRVLQHLSTSEAEGVRALFLMMVTDDQTRRILSARDASRCLGEDSNTLIEQLIKSRLITAHDQGHQEGTSYELAHESLITQWDRLKQWMKEGEEGLKAFASVERAYDLWSSRLKRDRLLLRDEDLTEAQGLLRRSKGSLPIHLVHYIQLSQRGEVKKRAQKRRWIIGIILALSTSSIVSLIQSHQASQAQAESDRLRLNADRLRERAEEMSARAIREERVSALKRGEALIEGGWSLFRKGAYRKARAKLSSALELTGEASVNARALWSHLVETPELWSHDHLLYDFNMAISPDGEWLASANQDHNIYAIHMKTGREVILRGHRDQVRDLVFDAQGRLYSYDFQARLFRWELDTFRHEVIFEGHLKSIKMALHHPTGRLAIGHKGAVSILKLPTSPILDDSVAQAQRLDLYHLPTDQLITQIIWGPTGADLFIGDKGGMLRRFDVTKRELLATRKLSDHRVHKLAFTPDDRTLLSFSESLFTLSPDTLQDERPPQALSGGATMSLSPDGRTLALAHDGLSLMSLQDQTLITRLPTAPARPTNIIWSPSGGALAVSFGDIGTLALYDLSSLHAYQPPKRYHQEAIHDVYFNPTGDRLLTRDTRSSAVIWDTETGALKTTLTSPEETLYQWRTPRSLIRVEPQRVSLITEEGRVSRCITRTYGERAVALHWSPHDERAPKAGTLSISTSRGLERYEITDLDRCELLDQTPLPSHLTHTTDSFNPLGTVLGRVSLDRRLALYLLPPLEGPPQLLGPSLNLYSVLSSTHERFINLERSNKQATVMKVSPTGAPLQTLVETSKLSGQRLHYPAFRADEQRIAFPRSDGLIEVYDADGDRLHLLEGHESEVNRVAFHPNGFQVASVDDHGITRLWDLNTGRPHWRTVGVIESPATLISHRGIESLNSRAQDRSSPSKSQPTPADESLTALVALSSSKRTNKICALDEQGALSIRRSPVAPLSKEDVIARLNPTVNLSRVRLIDSLCGCVLTSGDRSQRLSPSGSLTPLDELIVNVWGTETIELTQTATRLVETTTCAQPHTLISQLPPEVSAIFTPPLTKAGVTVGFKDGSMTHYPTIALTAPIAFSHLSHHRDELILKKVSTSAVSTLAQGPSGTIIAGFTDGQYGIWSLQDGALLTGGRLHGPIHQIWIEKGALYAVSTLGDVAREDIMIYQEPSEILISRILELIPYRWRRGQVDPILRRP